MSGTSLSPCTAQPHSVGCVSSFLANLCDTVDVLYEEDQPNEKEVLHKEEWCSTRRLGAGDWHRVATELSKHSHRLEGQGEDNVLYNSVNGKIAPHAVTVADAVSIGDNKLSVYRRSLASMPKCLVQ